MQIFGKKDKMMKTQECLKTTGPGIEMKLDQQINYDQKTQKISSTDNIIAGRNIIFNKLDNRVIISSDSLNRTILRIENHIIEGDLIEIESGDGIIINTTHPNKLKISIDYKFLVSIIERIEKLEKGV